MLPLVSASGEAELCLEPVSSIISFLSASNQARERLINLVNDSVAAILLLGCRPSESSVVFDEESGAEFIEWLESSIGLALSCCRALALELVADDWLVTEAVVFWLELIGATGR